MATASAFVVGIVDCPKLSIYARFLERKGYAFTQAPGTPCSVLVACPDHVGEEPVAAWGRKLQAPKLVLGGDPPSDWRDARRLELPLLPLHLERQMLAAKEGDAQPAPTGKSYDVVLVDDDATIREATVAALAEFGLRVRGCSGFGELTGALLAARPDFIILDLQLPGLSGESVGNLIRGRGIPTAVFSSSPQEVIDEARAAIGAVTGFSKTTSLVAMGRWVRNYLDRRPQ